MEVLPPIKPGWRWPLGWLYALTLGLDVGLVARLGWLFLRSPDRAMHWYWLASVLWLLLAGMGLLALAQGLVNAFGRRPGRALAWLVLSVLALGSCAAAFFPVAMVTVAAPSVGDPPHVDDL